MNTLQDKLAERREATRISMDELAAAFKEFSAIINRHINHASEIAQEELDVVDYYLCGDHTEESAEINEWIDDRQRHLSMTVGEWLSGLESCFDESRANDYLEKIMERRNVI